ncbi:MAG: hydrolase [Propionibacteriaceae bacterium]|jgi:nicotinamidase-related amidase|nr:hydrolase [Propionibacteriaceae bacterium]
MTSITPIREPRLDWLLTPANSAVLIIDYQPTQLHSINSMNTSDLVHHIVTVAKAAKAYNVPIVLSTVNVATTRNQETVPPLKEVLNDVPSYDRTSINAWEDQEFLDAVKATKRQKLIMCGLWTEACLTFPTIDALREGFEVYPVVDAVAGTTPLAHETALRRVEQAGAQLITIAQMVCEWQRDWNREETVDAYLDLMFEDRDFFGM